MSDALVVVGGSASEADPPPAMKLPMMVDALLDLAGLLKHREVRPTLIGISAIRAILLAELVEEVKTIGKDHKVFVDYIAGPGTTGGGAPSPAVPPSSPSAPGGTPSGSAAGPSSETDRAAAASGASEESTTDGPPPAGRVAAERMSSQFFSDLGARLKQMVQTPVDQLRDTVGTQAKAIEKAATGITELQVAHAASVARLVAMESNFSRLEAAHRRLSDHVVQLGIELGETEVATEYLEEAVREAGSPTVVVVETNEAAEPNETIRKTPARPMTQPNRNVRNTSARKKSAP